MVDPTLPKAPWLSGSLTRLHGVLQDIDCTMTTDGRLTAAAYVALEQLLEAGLLVIPISGRPAGWCDLIARFWPVSAVVGENGALNFRYDHRRHQMIRRYARGEAERAHDRLLRGREEVRRIRMRIVN